MQFKNKTKKDNQQIKCFQKFLTKLKELNGSERFQDFMLLIITTSLIIFALDDPFQSLDSEYNQTLQKIHISIFIIFVLQLIIDILSIGREKYLSYWLILNFFTTIIYLLYLIFDFKFLQYLMMLRFLHLLKFSKKLSLAVKALFRSLLDIIKLIVFFLLFCLGFALIGVVYLQGAYWHCQGLNEENLARIMTKEDCFDFGGDWINKDFNFDHVFNGLESLFIIANTEGWLPLM